MRPWKVQSRYPSPENLPCAFSLGILLQESQRCPATALMAHWSRFIRSLFQLSILCFLFINLTTAAEPDDAASSLQSNGVICSKGLFGSPAVDTCRRQLSRLPKTDNYQWFESIYDFFLDMPAFPGEPCAVDIGILPGAKNNVKWKTITGIASTIVETCSATPGAPGGWGVYGTNLPFPHLRGPCHKTGHPTNKTCNTYI